MVPRFLFFSILFSLLFLVQLFWFRALWRTSLRFGSKNLRQAIRCLYAIVIAVFVLRVLERTWGVRLLPGTGPLSWLASLIQVWLFTSLLAFLLFATVKVVE